MFLSESLRIWSFINEFKGETTTMTGLSDNSSERKTERFGAEIRTATNEIKGLSIDCWQHTNNIFAIINGFKATNLFGFKGDLGIMTFFHLKLQRS